MVGCLPRPHLFPHESSEDPSRSRPRRGYGTWISSPQGDFVDEELAITSTVASFLHFVEQTVAFEEDVGLFCNDGGQDLVHSC